MKNCQLMGCGAARFVSGRHWGVLRSSVSSSCLGGEKCGSPQGCNNVCGIISEHFCGSVVAGSDDLGSFSAIFPFVCGFSASFKVLLICDPSTGALCSLVVLFLEICFPIASVCHAAVKSYQKNCDHLERGVS